MLSSAARRAPNTVRRVSVLCSYPGCTVKIMRQAARANQINYCPEHRAAAKREHYRRDPEPYLTRAKQRTAAKQAAEQSSFRQRFYVWSDPGEYPLARGLGLCDVAVEKMMTYDSFTEGTVLKHASGRYYRIERGADGRLVKVLMQKDESK